MNKMNLPLADLNPPSILLIAGCVLILLGLISGGIRFKDAAITGLEKGVRGIAVSFGVCMIAIGIWLSIRSSPLPPVPPPSLGTITPTPTISIQLPTPTQSSESRIDGDWLGNFEPTLPVLLHIVDGGASTMDSPSQSFFGSPTKVSINGHTIRFVVPAIGVSFDGQIGNAGIDGHFLQNGQTFPLQLKRATRHDSGQISEENISGSTPISISALNGDWDGTLHLGPTLPLVLHFAQNGSSKFDSPAEFINGMHTIMTFDGNSVVFSVPLLNVNFSGTISGSEITGHLSKDRLNVPFILTRSH